jgi:hypothetical protein
MAVVKVSVKRPELPPVIRIKDKVFVVKNK